MIEQPLPRGQDEQLKGFRSPVPLAADESCLGLTRGLRLAELAQRDGEELITGNITGSSLSMAPAFVIGQVCTFVDIDGPLLLSAACCLGDGARPRR